MQMFDRKWGRILEDLGVRTWVTVRYVDDMRVALPPIKVGWRWYEGGLKYSKRWEQEDMVKNVTPERRTKELLARTMEGVEDFLEFTMESGEDFPGGWLPTLDTSLKVGDDNRILFKFYEKETTSIKTIQKRTAMEQNSKIQIVANDLVRRMCNTMEELGEEETLSVIDNYAQKLLNGGFDREETKGIIVRGLKGYEGRKRKCQIEGRALWRTAVESDGARSHKKLTAKTSWYKNRRKRNYYKSGGGSRHEGGEPKEPAKEESWEQKSILFVEQTREGELSKKLREVIQRLAPTLGFSIKVVERAGMSLKNKFPQSSLWDGAKCGRDRCTTCNQGAETLAPCIKKSMVYENICNICNEGAKGKEEVIGGATLTYPPYM